jgi:glycopeptide antibiotics resistance protein
LFFLIKNETRINFYFTWICVLWFTFFYFAFEQFGLMSDLENLIKNMKIEIIEFITITLIKFGFVVDFKSLLANNR